MKSTLRLAIVLAAAGGLIGCASQAPLPPLADDQLAAVERMRIQDELHRNGGVGRLPPEQREAATAKRARENELLERALTAAPDYQVAVRRVAIINATEDAPRRAGRSTPPTLAAIAAEEARLFDAVEVRRRSRLAEQGQQRQSQQDQQAALACINHGQQVEASMFNPRSLLNIEATITGVSARDQCIANYQMTRR